MVTKWQDVERNIMKEHKELAQCTKGTEHLTSKSKDNSISSIVLRFDEKIEDRLKVIFKQINKKSSMKHLL